MLYVPSGSLESTMLGTSFLKFLKLYLFGMYMYKVHVHVLFHTISVSAIAELLLIVLRLVIFFNITFKFKVIIGHL